MGKISCKKISFCIILFFFLNASIFLSSPPKSVWVIVIANERLSLEFSPFISNKLLYFNAEEIFQLMKYDIEEQEKEDQIKCWTLTKRELNIIANEKKITVDDKIVKLPNEILKVKQKIYIPLREVLAGIGISIYIDWKKREVFIYPQIKEIFQNFDVEKFRIEFIADSVINYDIKKLVNPDRIVLDIPHSLIPPSFPPVIEINQGIIKKIRASQHTLKPHPIARYVIDIEKPIAYSVSSSEKGEKIYLDFPHQILDIKFTKGEEKNIVEISSTGKLNYKFISLSQPERIVIDIFDAIILPQLSKIETEDEIIKGIRTSQFSITPDIARVVIDTTEKLEYSIFYDKDNPKKIICEIFIHPHFFRDKIIIIDPGHGGKDVGAVSPILGLLEKEVNLDIAKNLYSLLVPTKAEIYLTRDSDITLGLIERVKFAEEKKADIFVSIHCDAMPSDPNRSGATTYYYHSNSENLAKSIQQELIKETGVVSQGIKTAKFVVVYRTKIPSVLVEVSYFTNKVDEELLSQSEFRKKLAKGIFNGIRLYFKELEKNEKR